MPRYQSKHISLPRGPSEIYQLRDGLWLVPGRLIQYSDHNGSSPQNTAYLVFDIATMEGLGTEQPPITFLALLTGGQIVRYHTNVRAEYLTLEAPSIQVFANALDTEIPAAPSVNLNDLKAAGEWTGRPGQAVDIKDCYARFLALDKKQRDLIDLHVMHWARGPVANSFLDPRRLNIALQFVIIETLLCTTQPPVCEESKAKCVKCGMGREHYATPMAQYLRDRFYEAVGNDEAAAKLFEYVLAARKVRHNMFHSGEKFYEIAPPMPASALSPVMTVDWDFIKENHEYSLAASGIEEGVSKIARDLLFYTFFDIPMSQVASTLTVWSFGAVLEDLIKGQQSDETF